VKTWDLRSNSREPAATAAHGSAGVACLATHPTQVGRLDCYLWTHHT
jgi:hypothetical protein